MIAENLHWEKESPFGLTDYSSRRNMKILSVCTLLMSVFMSAYACTGHRNTIQQATLDKLGTTVGDRHESGLAIPQHQRWRERALTLGLSAVPTEVRQILSTALGSATITNMTSPHVAWVTCSPIGAQVVSRIVRPGTRIYQIPFLFLFSRSLKAQLITLGRKGCEVRFVSELAFWRSTADSKERSSVR